VSQENATEVYGLTARPDQATTLSLRARPYGSPAPGRSGPDSASSCQASNSNASTRASFGANRLSVTSKHTRPS
jgi:hypothetical protein